MTLIGYARGDGFNLYTHPERILYTPAAEPAPTR
ncbi:MAG: formate dehydrogenase accessory sulfurtransferase FdhD [candidate division NC10 bacterium]|nr:formate dehydrogenase accessory sulfurtransferase FdhD [candidate division NC10 bacterium]